MAQGTGDPIPGGAGLLTQIPWNMGDLGQVSGLVSISDLIVSGYFGTEITHEVGPPLNIESGLGLEEDTRLPNEHELHSAYPNPFNPNVSIPFELASKTHVELNIYDLRGKKVETLVSKVMDIGNHELEWNAASFASGVYIYALESNGQMITKKMILIK